MAKLTKTHFAKGMAALASRFNKDLEPLVHAMYAEALSILTAEEFLAAVKRAVTECEFFPTAKQLVEFARPAAPPEVEGGVVFTQLLHDPDIRTYHPRVGSLFDMRKIAERYGDVAVWALMAIGGGARLRNVTEDSQPWVLKEFREAYGAFAREVAARSTLTRLAAETPQATAGLHAGRYPELPHRLTSGLEPINKVLDDVPLSGRDRAAGE